MCGSRFAARGRRPEGGQVCHERTASPGSAAGTASIHYCTIVYWANVERRRPGCQCGMPGSVRETATRFRHQPHDGGLISGWSIRPAAAAHISPVPAASSCGEPVQDTSFHSSPG